MFTAQLNTLPALQIVAEAVTLPLLALEKEEEEEGTQEEEGCCLLFEASVRKERKLARGGAEQMGGWITAGPTREGEGDSGTREPRRAREAKEGEERAGRAGMEVGTEEEEEECMEGERGGGREEGERG